jgi:uncharacterized membrane protein
LGITICVNAVSGEANDDGRLADVRRQAKRRWWYLLAGIAAVAVVIGVITGLFTADHHQHRTSHDRGGLAGAIVLIAIGVVVLIVSIVAIRRARATGDFFRAPLSLGLPRSERRQAARAIRKSRPSSDPDLRAVERDVAERLVRNAHINRLVFPAIAVLDLAQAFLGDWTTTWRWIYVGIALLMVVAWVQQVVLTRRARRYLVAVEEEQRV